MTKEIPDSGVDAEGAAVAVAVSRDPDEHRFRVEKMKNERMKLLNGEMDILAVDAAERTASVANKGSFLAIAAGVLIAASTAQLWTSQAYYAIAALALACIAVLCATVAMRPSKRLGILARRLHDRYSNASVSAAYVLEAVVKDKAEALEARESDLASRSNWILLGFAALVLSAFALTIAVSVQLLGGP